MVKYSNVSSNHVQKTAKIPILNISALNSSLNGGSTERLDFNTEFKPIPSPSDSSIEFENDDESFAFVSRNVSSFFRMDALHLHEN